MSTSVNYNIILCRNVEYAIKIAPGSTPVITGNVVYTGLEKSTLKQKLRAWVTVTKFIFGAV